MSSATQQFTLYPVTTVTATVTGDAINLGQYDEVRLYANLDSTGGTSPTFKIEIIGQSPNGDDVTLDTFNSGDNITADGDYTLALTNFGDVLKAKITVGGTTPTSSITITGVGKTY